MKRREVLRSFVGVAAVAGSASAQRGTTRALSPDAIAELMQARGLEPQPGEAVQVLAFLRSTRPRSLVDPRIEPAIRLDPGMD